MSYQLFLDDIRTVAMVYPQTAESDFVIVRDHAAFKETILKHGLPSFISFDNDLGLDENLELAPDGYACAKWLVYESGLDLRELGFYVHSANPVAKVQIESLLNNYIRHLKGL
ncbi:MAG: hypothetical protein O9353_13875 [Bacteroidia bacterium]|nr:hypothetical protein [Bacteroidia bacterium]